MASLKECRARAKKSGLKVVVIPIKSKLGLKYRYKVNGYHVKTVQELSKAISSEIRDVKKHQMIRKLNGHRPKYGYKTVVRRRR